MNYNQLSITKRLSSQFSIPRWTIHAGYWVLWVIFWGVMWGTYDNNYSKTFHFQIVELPFKLLLVYPVIYILMPGLLLNRKYITFLFSYLTYLLIIGIALKLVWYYYLDVIYFPFNKFKPPLKPTEVLNVILTLNNAMIIPFSVKLIAFWMFHQNKSNTLERDKLEAELKYLKTQINPHFLFNALNSVYALSLKKSELTSNTISQLSDIMRYIIYEASEPLISLKEEIDFIESYVDFEKLRIEEDVDISLNIDSNDNKKIPPLLFIPIIENAFKHVRSFEGEKPWIVIQLECNKESIKLFVENSYKKDTIEEKKGIGLENLEKRLDILFPNKYKMEFSKQDYSFKSLLEINNVYNLA